MNQPNKDFLEGLTVGQPCVLFDLTVGPGAGCIVVSGPDEMAGKRFSRQLSVLRGYVCLALGALPGANGVTALETLKLPDAEGPDALLAVWYSRALAAHEPWNRLLALYNGFGALPGGFEAVPEVLSARLGQDAAEAVLAGVRAARLDEGDLAERAPQPSAAASWEHLRFDALERALLDAHRAAFR